MPDTVNQKISELPSASSPGNNDVLAGVQSNTTKKFTLSALKTFFQSGLTKSSVGLGNVDNTSDANKPVSTAQQAAIDAAKVEAGVHFGVCSTGGTVAAKEVNISGITSLNDGLKITVLFTNRHTAATTSDPITLNVNSLGAKNVNMVENLRVISNIWNAGEVLELIYLSTSDVWLIISGGYATTSQYGRTKLSSSLNSTSTNEAATPYAVREVYNKATDAEAEAELARVYKDYIVLSLSWSGSDPYTQIVDMADTMTANSKVDLQPTAAQLAQLIADGVQAITIENNDGILTVYALGATPSTAMTIDCVVTEVVQ